MGWLDVLGTLGSGALEYYGSQKAADAQKDAARAATTASRGAAQDAISAQMQMFNRTADMSQPWRGMGEQALRKLFYRTTGPKHQFKEEAFNFEADPGYQFRMNQGIEAVNRGASAAGMLDSGARNKDLIRFGQGIGSDEYGRAYNRWETNRNFQYNQQQNVLNRLAAMAGVGQTAAAQTGQAASNAGANMSSAYSNFGNNAAQSAIYGGQGAASGYINAANSGSNMLNNLIGLNKV